MKIEKTLFINHQPSPRLNRLSVTINLGVIIFISTLIGLFITYFVEGKFYLGFISFILSAIAAIIKIYTTKTTISIKFDEDNRLLIITQKNGFEKLRSKRMAIDNTDLSPLSKESGELKFDFISAYSIIPISSAQKGVSKTDVRNMHKLMRDKFGLMVRRL
ncbi:hypothetical protein [Leeuwenhoekiella parthenopeia]|uniref:YcxB-like protein domain-containing protein n=1 Tax=Leeuwenhoekiella parthenopeia TaxID=2890320 RepID=A0ABS8GYT6_9FLAO|nr:hypothetical protein [Leeuwenhoekiella parthenopeia]MCC4214693.1 hypothetical protein [Leeuwenhoekiella parthenopeia]